jgi:hypothetical protein
LAVGPLPLLAGQGGNIDRKPYGGLWIGAPGRRRASLPLGANQLSDAGSAIGLSSKLIRPFEGGFFLAVKYCGLGHRLRRLQPGFAGGRVVDRTAGLVGNPTLGGMVPSR